MADVIYFCEFCSYSSARKYNVIRHSKTKHLNKTQPLINEEKEEVAEVEKQEDENIIFNCLKCGKKYKTQKYFIKHLNNCDGLFTLQCPKCMKLFSHRSSKSYHIKYINCTAKTILNNKIQQAIINNNNININNINNNNNNNTKKKKQSISATLKRLVWNINIGEAIGKAKCLCCKFTDITQMSFNCGHVIAEANGGETILSNLKPICQNCNSSMGTKNMYDFIKKFK